MVADTVDLPPTDAEGALADADGAPADAGAVLGGADGVPPEQAANRPPAVKSAKTRRNFIPLLSSP